MWLGCSTEKADPLLVVRRGGSGVGVLKEGMPKVQCCHLDCERFAFTSLKYPIQPGTHFPSILFVGSHNDH